MCVFVCVCMCVKMPRCQVVGLEETEITCLEINVSFLIDVCMYIIYIYMYIYIYIYMDTVINVVPYADIFR